MNHFAADVDPVKARVMYAVQQPLAAAALQDVMGVPVWKSYPSWYLVAANDEAIPPDAERLFASRMGAITVEVASSHVAMVSHPDEVAQLIKTAAEAVQAASHDTPTGRLPGSPPTSNWPSPLCSPHGRCSMGEPSLSSLPAGAGDMAQ